LNTVFLDGVVLKRSWAGEVRNAQQLLECDEVAVPPGLAAEKAII